MDFVNRFASIYTALQTHGADVFLLLNSEYSGQPGTRYLSGFTGSASALIIGEGRVQLLTDGRYIAQARSEALQCQPMLVGDIAVLAQGNRNLTESIGHGILQKIYVSC